MAELSKIFKSNDLYEAWRNDKDIPSNVLAVVLDETGNDVEKVAFGTNDITGEYTTYEVEKAEEQPLQAIGYMFNNYIGMPLYDMYSGEEYPCRFLQIAINQDYVTTFEGYSYIKYNRGLTADEITAEKAKITGENIESSDIEVNTIAGAPNILEIRWTNTDEYMSSSPMTIYYDGYGIFTFSNMLYTTYCNTGVIVMGNTAQITPQNWDEKIELIDIVMDGQTSTVYHTDGTGEYHIMVMAADYQSGNLLNFPVEVLFNNGLELVKKYNVSPTTAFHNNGLRGYIFNFQDVPTSATIDNIEVYWGNATYKIVFI